MSVTEAISTATQLRRPSASHDLINCLITIPLQGHSQSQQFSSQKCSHMGHMQCVVSASRGTSQLLRAPRHKAPKLCQHAFRSSSRQARRQLTGLWESRGAEGWVGGHHTASAAYVSTDVTTAAVQCSSCSHWFARCVFVMLECSCRLSAQGQFMGWPLLLLCGHGGCSMQRCDSWIGPAAVGGTSVK